VQARSRRREKKRGVREPLQNRNERGDQESATTGLMSPDGESDERESISKNASSEKLRKSGARRWDKASGGVRAVLSQCGYDSRPSERDTVARIARTFQESLPSP